MLLLKKGDKMSKFLFAPFMMNLGESQRLSKLANCLY
ncbi:CylJ, partial [Streptococcus agalactiae COH1]